MFIVRLSVAATLVTFSSVMWKDSRDVWSEKVFELCIIGNMISYQIIMTKLLLKMDNRSDYCEQTCPYLVSLFHQRVMATLIMPCCCCHIIANTFICRRSTTMTIVIIVDFFFSKQSHFCDIFQMILFIKRTIQSWETIKGWFENLNETIQYSAS